MKKIVEFPDQSVVAEEAAEWLIRLDADTPPTRRELRALGEWLHRSPAHREELERLVALWSRMNVLTELAVPLGKHSRPTVRNRLEASDTPERWLWRRAGLLVASVVVALALGLALLARGPTTDPLLATNGLYATAVGQQKATTLADGSAIILNTNTKIRVDYSHEYRQVHLLQGEALFTVATNADRPFRVYAGNGRIEALGTEFSVYIKGSDVNVTVTEGRVSLASVNPTRVSVLGRRAPVSSQPQAAGSVRDPADDNVESLGTLHAGQVATISRSIAEAAGGGGIIENIQLKNIQPIAPEELAQRLAWQHGILTFSGDTLQDVVHEISRYTTVSIEIPDAAVREMRIGGRFPVGETDTMLAVLENNFNLSVTHLSHNRVVLSAANE